MSVSTYRNLIARSDVQKGEVSPDTDLRARSAAVKVVIDGTYATMTQTVGGLTQVATGWAEATGTIVQTEVGNAITQAATGLVQSDLAGTVAQTTPAITQSASPTVINQLRKCKLTVQSSEVSGSSNLTDFPVLLRKECLPSEMFDSDGSYPAQADGGDILVTSDEAGATLLPVEVVAFDTDADPANGYAEIWTKITVDHDDDTDLWIWYNTTITSSQPPADSPYGSEAVWSDYAYVGHNLLTDSAGNYTPVDTGTAAATNQWGNTTGARDFNSYNDILRVPVDIDTEGTYVFSIQAWARARTESQFKIYSAGDSGGTTWWSIDGWSSTSAIHSQINGGGSYIAGHADDRAKDVWRKWTSLVTDYNSETTIINGGSTEWLRNSGSDPRPHNNIAFGNVADSTVYGQYPGDVCEGRLRFGSGITADWVYTEYANQNDPGAFIVEGTPTAFDFVDAPPTAAVAQTTPAITQVVTGTTLTGTAVQTLPAITQAIAGTHVGASTSIAPIAVHHMNQMRAA
jgi:hypothetical protein